MSLRPSQSWPHSQRQSLPAADAGSSSTGRAGATRATPARAGASWLAVVLVLLVVAVAAVGVWFVWRNGDNELPQPQKDPVVTLPVYERAVEAVAASEEADFRRATKLWTELIDAQPDNDTFKLNQAVTVLKWIENVNIEISSGQVDAQRMEILQAELEEAYALVEAVSVRMAEHKLPGYRAAFVEAALLEKKSLADPSSSALRKQAADILAAELREKPGQLLLAVKFDELATELEQNYPDLQLANADFLLAAFESHPRNLFVLKRAAEVLMANRDPRLKQLLKPSVELARPMMDAPGVARSVERLNPDGLIEEVAQAIDANEWPKVQRLRGWLNLLMGMSGFKADGKLAKPDVLALLETNFLTDLAARLPYEPAPTDIAMPDYLTSELAAPANVAVWYDFDFDLDFDVALTTQSELRIHELRERQLQPEPAVIVELGFSARGILPVDLFRVDLPNRPLVPGSVEELMETNAESQALTPEQIARANRHNTLQELLIWGEAGVRVVTLGDMDEFVLVETTTGLEELSGVLDVAAADFESDGDLDLAIATEGGLRLMQNNGNRTFTEITRYSSLPADCSALIVCDFDLDTDQDFLVLSPATSQAVLLENILHGQFRTLEFTGETWLKAADAVAVAVADVDGNASWDYLTTGPEQSHITFTQTLADPAVTARNRVALPLGGNCLAVDDLNNDGALDLIVGGSQGIRALRGFYDDTGERRFASESIPLAAADKSVTSMSVLDADGDGMLDLLGIADGLPVMCLAAEHTGGSFVLTRVRGVDDDNGGGRVNHYAVGTRLELWAAGELFTRVIQHPVTHFGLGNRQPDNLRIIFPNGLTQNVEELPTNVLVEEKQIPRGSCPYVYGWDGERFQLITDLLWNAPLGLQIARDQVLPDRRWENLLLPARFMQPREGMIELRVTEELWEVAYFDHIQLTAVDHPADIRLFTNEKVGPPHLAQHQLFGAQQRLAPQSATDSHGRDVLDRIAARDGVVVQAFNTQICQGLCEPHFVELNFGRLPIDEQQLRLFLTGWMNPTDTSLNIGIDQNSERPLPEPPSLWVVGKEGEWVCAQPVMGFPGGKTKSIVIDLAGVFQSEDHRLRVATSQQLYWDEAFISWHAGDQHIHQQPLRLAAAELRYRGFSELLPRATDQPHWFDYQQVSRAPQWPPLEGPFTRFGDVRELLAEDDDRMVVIVSGDEIVLRFAPPQAELPNGWVRDYVMHNTGWDKDADINTIAGQGSMPLPFKNHKAYPAPPEQADEAQAVWRKNASTLTRQRQVDPRRTTDRLGEN